MVKKRCCKTKRFLWTSRCGRSACFVPSESQCENLSTQEGFEGESRGAFGAVEHRPPCVSPQSFDLQDNLGGLVHSWYRPLKNKEISIWTFGWTLFRDDMVAGFLSWRKLKNKNALYPCIRRQERNLHGISHLHYTYVFVSRILIKRPF